MAQQHAAAIRLQDNAQLVAVADPYVSPGDIKQRFGESVETFDDPLALIERCKPDIAHIVTPPSTHADLARHCVEHGVHAYVEKPFAPTVKDAEELLDLAASKGVKLCPAHQVLFQRPGQRYQDYLATIDLYAAFKSEQYDGQLAGCLIGEAQDTARRAAKEADISR
jgi:predicted dehydrogenase